MNIIQLLMQTGESHYRTGILPGPDGMTLLAGIDFRPLDLDGITAEGIIFDGCMFDGVEIRSAEFSSCIFDSCTMDGARISETNFTGCRFGSVSMTDAFADTVKFVGCHFEILDLEDTHFSGCTFDLPRHGTSILRVNDLVPLVVLDIASGPVAMLGHGRFESIGRVIDRLSRLARQETAEVLGLAASYRVYEAALTALADAE